MTPKELGQRIDAFVWNMRREHDRDMVLAYTTAALHRAKRMKPLKSLMSPPPKARNLTGEELERRTAEHERIVDRMMPDGR